MHQFLPYKKKKTQWLSCVSVMATEFEFVKPSFKLCNIKVACLHDTLAAVCIVGKVMRAEQNYTSIWLDLEIPIWAYQDHRDPTCQSFEIPGECQ